MQDYLLFVDTETSGIPHSLKSPISELDKWPFVLQLAWAVYDRSGALIKQENHYIYEDDISIRQSATRVHGITLEELKQKGEDRKAVMRQFTKDLRQYKPLLVGHFIEFDSKMLQVALLRSGMKNIITRYPVFCTMKATTEYARYPDHNYPKLDELYLRLFGRHMERQHDAAVDATATAACFWALYHKGELTRKLLAAQPIYTQMKSKARAKMGCGLPVFVFIISSILLWLL
ncbi:MAG: 3'-5' exonuclease [Marinoscillum sp.]|uniref:3'-5' exonuclease n=2 Tax=Marinoscillum sp. TaxID=2024838 RepID=UPI0032F136B0